MIFQAVLLERRVLAPHPRQAQRVAQEIAAAAAMAADHDVLEHGHVAKQRQILKRAADADLGDPVRRLVEDGLALKLNVAMVRRVEPAEAIEQGGLAGAVRADQAQEHALGHVERHVVERDDAAETHADILDRQQRRSRPQPRACLRGLRMRGDVGMHQRAPKIAPTGIARGSQTARTARAAANRIGNLPSYPYGSIGRSGPLLRCAPC